MNAKDIGSKRTSQCSGPREPHKDDQAALQLLEHIERSLVDLRQALEVSARDHRAAATAAAGGQAPIDWSSNDPTQPLRIVLINEDSASPTRRSPTPLSKVLAGVSVDELRAALEQRDDYITYLCGAIREMTIRIEAWLRLLQERSLTEETAVVLKDAEACVRQLVKMSEVELAIERAELGRERAQFEADRREFNEERERAVLECGASAEATLETPMMQRWRRFLTVKPAPHASPARSGTSGTGP